jgi:Ca-activated chloride channel family protein
MTPAGESGERYLRVRITAPKGESVRRRLPLNLALVLDRSGSMSGSKLDKAKEAADYCVRQLGEDDRIALVTYDDEVDLVSPSREMNSKGQRRLRDDIRRIESGGNTNLGGGWLAGAKEVAAHNRDGNLGRVILLTDGLANVGMTDPAELAHHAAELRARGVSTTTMGIGADFNEDLLERMARKGGGHFYFIENARQIPDMLRRELGETLSTVWRGVVLELTLPRGVEAGIMNDFEAEHDGNRVRVRLDDLVSGENRAPVFRLHVPPGEAGSQLPFELNLRYNDVASGEARTVKLADTALTYVARAEAEQEAPDAAVREEVELLNVARAREQALQYDAAGDYAQSQATLAGAAAALRAAAPASPVAQAEAAKLEAESQAAPGGLTGLARKAMHYSKSNALQNRKE